MTDQEAPLLNAPTGWVYIPVPIDHAAAALDAVASLVNGRAAAPATTAEIEFATPAPSEPAERGSAATSSGNQNGVWPQAGYDALRASTTVSASRVVRIGDVLATADLVSMTDLARLSGVAASEIRQALGKLTLFVEARPEIYGEAVVWPFGWWYGRDISTEDPREFHYNMTDEQKAAWLA